MFANLMQIVGGGRQLDLNDPMHQFMMHIMQVNPGIQNPDAPLRMASLSSGVRGLLKPGDVMPPAEKAQDVGLVGDGADDAVQAVATDIPQIDSRIRRDPEKERLYMQQRAHDDAVYRQQQQSASAEGARAIAAVEAARTTAAEVEAAKKAARHKLMFGED